MKSLRTIDLFAGCGGLTLGLHNSGHRLLFSIEKDPMAFESYYSNFLDLHAPYPVGVEWPAWLPQSPLDIEMILKKKELLTKLRALRGSVDLVCGGPPCQGFSVGGIRDGQDQRNRLPLRYLEFTDAVRPTFVLLENVEGMARRFRSKPHEHEGSYADWLASEFDRRGYDVHFQVVNAADFGVPQVRRRVFIFGFLREVFPEAGTTAKGFFETLYASKDAFLKSKGLPTSHPVSVRDAIDDLDGSLRVRCPDSQKFMAGTYKTAQSAYSRLMRQGISDEEIPDSHRFSKHLPHTLAFYEKVHQDKMFGRLPKAYLRAHGTKKDKKVLIDPSVPASTITTHPDEFIHYRTPRNISVREMARLQSFPDNFQFRGRYTINGERRRIDVARCSQVGNAVPPLLAEALGLALSAFITSLEKQKPVTRQRPKRTSAVKSVRPQMDL